MYSHAQQANNQLLAIKAQNQTLVQALEVGFLCFFEMESVVGR